MNTNNAFKFPYFLVGMGLGAIAGVLLAPRSGGDIRKYLRERSKDRLEYLNQRAQRLRQSAEGMVDKGKELVSRNSDSVDIPIEGERLAYEEKKRENMGG